MGKVFNLNGIITETFEIPFEGEMMIDEFIKNNPKLDNIFEKVCNVLIDNDINESGQELRKTEIKFVPIIDSKRWNAKKDWVYIFTFNGHVVKFGSTSDGLKGRTGSYLCGSRWNREKGTCSTTNFIIYNAILQYLSQGIEVEIYGYELPEYKVTIELFGEDNLVKPSLCKIYEKKIIDLYVDVTGDKPCLSNNK